MRDVKPASIAVGRSLHTASAVLCSPCLKQRHGLCSTQGSVQPNHQLNIGDAARFGPAKFDTEFGSVDLNCKEEDSFPATELMINVTSDVRCLNFESRARVNLVTSSWRSRLAFPMKQMKKTQSMAQKHSTSQDDSHLLLCSMRMFLLHAVL